MVSGEFGGELQFCLVRRAKTSLQTITIHAELLLDLTDAFMNHSHEPARGFVVLRELSPLCLLYN